MQSVIVFGVLCNMSSTFLFVTQVRIMRKRLVRKTFDMIQDLSEKEDNEVVSFN
jgi:hypothetical protein